MAVERWFTVEFAVSEQADGAAYFRDKNTYCSHMSLDEAKSRYGARELLKALDEARAQLLAGKSETTIKKDSQGQ